MHHRARSAGRRERDVHLGGVAPGEHHWHGAGPDTVMTHIAISLGVTDWGDPVSDEDYLA
jgi:hypothetical protein